MDLELGPPSGQESVSSLVPSESRLSWDAAACPRLSVGDLHVFFSGGTLLPWVFGEII